MFILLLMLLAPLSHAFRLEPMVLPLPLTKPQASGTYTVENNSKQKIALQFELRQRTIDQNGKEERPEATGFLVYPEQMALEPGEKRNVRVTWTGDAMPTEEKAFRLVATQLPVNFDKDSGPKGAQLKFLLEYVASLYLTPPKVKPRMKVVKNAVNDKGILEILLANEGNEHFLLDRLEISYSLNGKETKPAPALLQEMRTENLLPGNQRWLRIPLTKGAKVANLSVKFEP